MATSHGKFNFGAVDPCGVCAPSATPDGKGGLMIELNVLRSPGREEVTRIAFYRDRGYRNTGRQESPAHSLITIDSSYSSTLPDAQSRAPETAPVAIGRDETLKLRVFVDRSVVEVFVNGR